MNLGLRPQLRARRSLLELIREGSSRPSTSHSSSSSDASGSVAVPAAAAAAAAASPWPVTRFDSDGVVLTAGGVGSGESRLRSASWSGLTGGGVADTGAADAAELFVTTVEPLSAATTATIAAAAGGSATSSPPPAPLPSLNFAAAVELPPPTSPPSPPPLSSTSTQSLQRSPSPSSSAISVAETTASSDRHLDAAAGPQSPKMPSVRLPATHDGSRPCLQCQYIAAPLDCSKLTCIVYRRPPTTMAKP